MSTTGVGEALYRSLAAVRIAENLSSNSSKDKAIRHVLDQMTKRVGGDGGAIAIDSQGQIAIEWNSARMAWAYVALLEENCLKVEVHWGCNKNEHFVEELGLCLTES